MPPPLLHLWSKLEPAIIRPEALGVAAAALGLLALLMSRTLYRLVLREVLRPMMTGLVVFVLLFVSNTLLFNLMDFLLNQKVPAPVVAKVLVYNLPALALLAVPVSFLLGVVLGLGRMGQDFELVAARIGGVSYARVCLPVYGAALMVSALALLLNQTLAPVANRRAQDLLREYLFRSVVETSEAERVVKTPEHRVFILGRGGKNLLLYDATSGTWPVIYSARRVTWQGGDWQLAGGQVMKFDKKGRLAFSARLHRMGFNFEQAGDLYRNPVIAPEEKTIEELKQEAAALPADSIAAREIMSQIHHKLALPFATFCFAVIGAPLSIASARVRYGAFLFSVLAAGVYYVGLGVTPPLARAGALAQWLASAHLSGGLWATLSTHQAAIFMWSTTALFVLVGSLLTWRVSRR